MATAAATQDDLHTSPSTGTRSAHRPITVGVLALQGAFIEHISLLTSAATSHPTLQSHTFHFQEIRTPAELSRCDALVLPGGESTSISLIAERTNLLDPLRDFVKLHRKPTWGTCAGLILLAESANRSKATGQALIGGLDVRVQRNYFGRQVESFEAELEMPFLSGGAKEDERGLASGTFPAVFIRAPVVEAILSPAECAERVSEGTAMTLPSHPANPDPAHSVETTTAATTVVHAPPKAPTSAPVEILARLPGRAKSLRDKTLTAEALGEEGDIVAVRQGNVFGTAFHPELTKDARIHAWWLTQVVSAVKGG